MPAQQSTLWDWADPKPRVKRSRLRPYQLAAVDAIINGFNTHRTGLCVEPTGTGKTVIAAELVRRWFETVNTSRVLFLAESRQILRQAAAKLEAWTGRLGDVALEQAGNYAGRERVVCGSRQTLASDVRLERLAQDPPGLIIVDEAHHAGKRGGEYQKILDRFPKANVVGMTATPDRGDKVALETAFSTVFHKYEIHEAIDDGWLVPVVTPTVANWEALDISRIRKHHGELDEKQLEQLLAEVVKDQARAAVEACGARKSMVFCGRVETAHQMAAAICALVGNRGAARAVDGGLVDDEKDAILDAYKAGEFQFLVNVGICVEGFDDPPTSAAVMTRPYLSRGRFTQVCGRPLRPVALVDEFATAEERRAAIAASNKPNAALINFRYIAGKHTLVCPSDILGGKYPKETRARADKLREEDAQLTVGASLQKAQQQLDRGAQVAERARKAKLAAEASEREKAQWGSYNAFDRRPDYWDENDRPQWLGQVAQEPPEPITPGQYKFLRWVLHVKPMDIPRTKKEAGRLIGQLKTKQKEAVS